MELKLFSTVKSLSLEANHKLKVFRAYFRGHDFERDLDDMISSLKISDEALDADFTGYTSREKRLAAKLRYLAERAGVVVTMCSAAGAELGLKLGRGNKAVVVDAAAAGAAAGVLIVGFFAGRVIVKRYQNAGAIDVTKLEMAIE